MPSLYILKLFTLLIARKKERKKTVSEKFFNEGKRKKESKLASDELPKAEVAVFIVLWMWMWMRLY